MSAIHQCNDGTEDITGRGTPNKIPCENQGGEVGKSQKDENPISLISMGEKTSKTTQLIFVIVAAGSFALLGRWVYNKYLNK